jgi:Alpha/beta hydrolase domain
VAVVSAQIAWREEFAGGRRFGDAGPYELVRYRMKAALDPGSPANAAVTDIDHAARSACGHVEAETDVLVLRPAGHRRGNGCLLCVVPNRGTTGGMPFSYDGPPRFGAEAGLRPGDGWLLRSGWTVCWTGWQWDVPRTAASLGCSVPEVVDAAGRPLEGTVRVELQPFLAPAPWLPLRSASDLTRTCTCYPASDPAQSDALLQVATRRGEPFVAIPRAEWSFARPDADGRLVSDREAVWLAGGFRPDRLYRVRYRTSRCPLVGAGLAVFRDVASYLRVSDDQCEHVFAAGWSQSRRFLRQFLLDGFNLDEGGRRVFDAVLPFIAGASRGEFNQRYGQPAEALAEGAAQQPPYAIADLSAADWARGSAPKVISVNTASEYWRADGSLGHIDAGGADIRDDDPATRDYYLAGTEHLGGGALGFAIPGPPRNHLSLAPLNRAVLELARRWVVDGRPPPATMRPRVDDGTAIPRPRALREFGAVTGLPLPDEETMLQREDGHAAAPGERHPSADVYVSALDEDGNEVAGIRHPELSVPLATHTGWNLLLAAGPQWAALSALTGNSHPFSLAEGDGAGPEDQRRPVAARYRDREDYLVRLKAAALDLAAEGFLLTEDINRVVATAGAHYDLFSRMTSLPLNPTQPRGRSL